MSALNDFLKWQQETPPENQSSTVKTNYAPMSADEFKNTHDGSIEELNRQAFSNETGTNRLQIGKQAQAMLTLNKPLSKNNKL